jgi:hypothetical protein
MISDTRNMDSFKTSTFSNYKLTDVKNRLIHSLQVSDIHASCYWSVELVCSNHYERLWDIIFYFYSTYINVSNPKGIAYIDKRFKSFKLLYETNDNPFELRNHPQIRMIFCEIMVMLCLSDKLCVMNYVDVPKDDYNMTLIHTKYRAINDDYITPYYREDDPKHMMTLFNEFVFNLKIGNCFRAYYWLEFILGYEKILLKYKEKSTSGVRTLVHVSSSHSKDIIWIVWEIIIKMGEERGAIYKTLATSALHLFTIKYSQSSKQTKKYLIYCAISLITTNIDMNIPIFNGDMDMEVIMENTNQIYKQLIKIQQINLLP